MKLLVRNYNDRLPNFGSKDNLQIHTLQDGSDYSQKFME